MVYTDVGNLGIEGRLFVPSSGKTGRLGDRRREIVAASFPELSPLRKSTYPDDHSKIWTDVTPSVEGNNIKAIPHASVESRLTFRQRVQRLAHFSTGKQA